MRDLEKKSVLTGAVIGVITFFGYIALVIFASCQKFGYGLVGFFQDMQPSEIMVILIFGSLLGVVGAVTAGCIFCALAWCSSIVEKVVGKSWAKLGIIIGTVMFLAGALNFLNR